MHDAMIEIGPRFCGPPGTANGGYAAGLLAVRMAPTAEPVTVRLRRPLPLGTAIEIRRPAGAPVELVRGGETLATAAPGRLELVVPRATTFDAATRISRSFQGFHRHPFPRCFVCGPARHAGDGLRIFPGPWRLGEVVGPWVPDAGLDAGDGTVRLEHVWAALDCPGYFAVARDGRPMLLGQMTARIGRAIRVSERCVVLGFVLEAEGRRQRVGTAIFGEDGALCGAAEGIWFEPRLTAQSAVPSGSSSGTESACAA